MSRLLSVLAPCLGATCARLGFYSMAGSIDSSVLVWPAAGISMAGSPVTGPVAVGSMSADSVACRRFCVLAMATVPRATMLPAMRVFRVPLFIIFS